ncbi:dienelactone hydrolase family protein [Paraburkholderia sp. J67]|uniref:dienelactone hydrolase family protein n=1 Tax=Paraburkholderia sp. J67 TaxID=2805435 RepID=UPI002ABDC5E2|nr:dienelactone hydrolase family protein [Paraburkholderia sp. J67]
MSRITGQVVEYTYEDARLVGYLSRDEAIGGNQPGIVIVHDAFGVSEFIKGIADRVAALGYAVLAADVWGDGLQLRDESQIGPTIGRFVGDRATWMGRLRAAHETLVAQPGVDGSRIVFTGYCFGGASVLEYLRTGAGVAGVVSLHGGLDLLGDDWQAARAGTKALVLTGFDDPMAAAPKLLALQQHLNAAKIDWEVDSYGLTRHGFTNPHADRAGRPEVIAYNAQAERRSWAAMCRFLAEALALHQ